MIVLQRIQTVVTSLTMVGVWSNLYLNFNSNIEKKIKEEIQANLIGKR